MALMRSLNPLSSRCRSSRSPSRMEGSWLATSDAQRDESRHVVFGRGAFSGTSASELAMTSSRGNSKTSASSSANAYLEMHSPPPRCKSPHASRSNKRSRTKRMPSSRSARTKRP